MLDASSVGPGEGILSAGFGIPISKPGELSRNDLNILLIFAVNGTGAGAFGKVCSIDNVGSMVV